MTTLRQLWREYKRQFDQHLRHVFGKNWTQAFDSGLGPTLDKLDREYTSAFQAKKYLEKWLDKDGGLNHMAAVIQHARKYEKAFDKVEKTADKALQKLDKYEGFIRQRAGTIDAWSSGPNAQLLRQAVGSICVIREHVDAAKSRAIGEKVHAEYYQRTYKQQFKAR